MTPRITVVVCLSGAPSLVSILNMNYGKVWPMKRRRVIAVSTVTITVIAALFFSSQTVFVSAQNEQHEKGEPPFPIYNPYPPGILPANLQSEIARVLREIDVIEQRAI